MSRRYDEHVEVRRRDDRPTEFLWRNRFYAVREVLAHWVETTTWWQPTAHPAEGEREVWRVEASAGRAAGSGIYDLSFDWAAGRWSLVRAMD